MCFFKIWPNVGRGLAPAAWNRLFIGGGKPPPYNLFVFGGHFLWI